MLQVCGSAVGSGDSGQIGKERAGAGSRGLDEFSGGADLDNGGVWRWQSPVAGPVSRGGSCLGFFCGNLRLLWADEEEETRV